MLRQASCVALSVALIAGAASFSACESDDTFGLGTFQLPDSGLVNFDATPGEDAAFVAPDAGEDAGIEDAGVDSGVDAADADAGPIVTYTDIVGGGAAALYEDACPAGQYVIGIEAGAVVGG